MKKALVIENVPRENAGGSCRRRECRRLSRKAGGRKRKGGRSASTPSIYRPHLPVDVQQRLVAPAQRAHRLHSTQSTLPHPTPRPHFPIHTFWSTCSSGLLPMYSAPISCSAGISSGKLKGVMMVTGPYGHLRPLLVWPMWSPGLLNPRARKRTCGVGTRVLRV